MSSKISHSGIVESVAGGCVKVRILQTSACAGCKVASHCNASESKEKIIDVYQTDGIAARVKVGDSVMVSASRDVANRALLLGFGVPFLVLVVVLIVVLRLSGNEGLSALVALLSLAPYYGVLWLCRDKIQRRLRFYLET